MTSPAGAQVWFEEKVVYDANDRIAGVESPHGRSGASLATSGDGSTTIVEGRNTYDPYGRAVSLPTWSGAPVPYGFTGQRQDGATGLFPMYHRWHDPETGRFIEQDPIGESGGLNVYAYVGSSPTMRVDPTRLRRLAAYAPNVWQKWVGSYVPRSFHELLHAYLGATGTEQLGELPDRKYVSLIDASEWQVIGWGSYAGNLPTENRFCRESELKERDSHLAP